MRVHPGAVLHTQEALRWSKRVSTQRYLRLVARLMRMTPGEAATRAFRLPGQQLLSSAGLKGISYGRRRSEFLQRLQPHPRERISKLVQDRFLFGPLSKTSFCAHLRSSVPAGVERVIAKSESLDKEGIDILGLRLRLVPGFDWQADPRSGRLAWNGRLSEQDAIGSTDADVKYVWEVNRHQYLTLLGRAFWLTEDSSHARRAVELIQGWITANPFPSGVNWSSHLEVGMRAVSWLWTLPYLLSWPELDSRFLEDWLGSLVDHYCHLAENLSVYTDPTNHLIGEATALWLLASVFPGLPDASRQSQRSLEILTREVQRQISEDGVNREQATSYHRFVLDFFLQIIALARRLSLPLPGVIEQRVETGLAFVAAIVGENGEPPMIGDSDDARGLPMPELVGWDFRDLLSTGAVLFGRPDWKKLSGGLAEATIWLLGVEAIEKYRSLGDQPVTRVSRVFSAGGYCVFRRGDSHTQLETIFDVGPLGLWPNAAHGHADALSILIGVNGKLILTDPGTGTYFGSPTTRDRFRSSAAHNTLTVDGFDQADIFDVFKWINPMSVKLLASHMGQHFDYALAMHDGYCRLRDSITHYRHLLFIPASGWIIADRVEGKGEHMFTRNFHFVPEARIQRDSSYGVAVTDAMTGSGLSFSFSEEDGPSAPQYDEGGCWSESYGKWRKSPRLKVETRCAAPKTFFTFISPLDSRRPSPAENIGAAAWVTERLNPCGAVLSRRHSLESVSDEMVLVNPKQSALSLPGGLSSNASFLFVSRGSGGSIRKAFFSGERSYLSNGTVPMGGNDGPQFVSFVDDSFPPQQSSE